MTSGSFWRGAIRLVESTLAFAWVGKSLRTQEKPAALARLVERITHNEKVIRSILTGGSNRDRPCCNDKLGAALDDSRLSVGRWHK